MRWIFENTGFHTGVFNMEYDVALAQALVQGIGNPTIRIYGWQPHAISLGWNQSLEEINSDEAKNAGIDIVRRPTGGRAILHSDELTYSVVSFANNKNTLMVYKDISEALVIALEYLGIDVSVHKNKIEQSTYQSKISTASCFSSISMYEIKYEGKKIIGSAQRRYITDNGDEVILQHGSLPISRDYLRIIDFINFDSEIQKESTKNKLEETSIDLSTAANRQITFEEAGEAILYGFKKAWSIEPELKGFFKERKAIV